MNDPANMIDLTAARRTFLSRSALGLGSVALAGLLPANKAVATTPSPGQVGLKDLPHFAPRAPRRISQPNHAAGIVLSATQLPNFP